MHAIGIALAITLAALAGGCSGGDPAAAGSPAAEFAMGDGSATSGDLAVSHGNVVVAPGRPGLAFAWAAAPGRSKGLVYFLVFDHDLPDAGVESESACDGWTASTYHTIASFGRTCTVDYEIDLDETGQAVEAERIAIDGQPYDPSAGRVFLVDMRADGPRATQLDLALPASVPALRDTEASRAFGREALAGLRAADERVDAFCRRLTKGR